MLKFSKKILLLCLVLSVIVITLFIIKLYNNDNQKKTNSFNINKKSSHIELIPDKNALMENLNNICSNIRNFNSSGSAKTSKYIEKKLLEFNYNVTFQNFDIYEQNSKSTLYAEKDSDYLKLNPYNSKIIGKGKNIIAKQKQFDKNKKTIYLTAHYDTTQDTSGVIDNGTGTSVVLEVAKILKDFKSDFNLVMIFFDAEEYFRYGSRYFVSTLENKENIIGCINIDMVGEKNANNIVMKTPTGKMNILSVTIDNILNNKFKLSHGGSSDDLSFYMGKIPAITFADESPNLNLDKESTENQIKNLDMDKLSNICQSISELLVNLDLSTYFKKLKSNLTTNLQNYENTIKDINNFTLSNTKEILIENGFDVKVEYEYKNSDDNKVVISKQSQTFIPKKTYSNFITSRNDSNWHYKLENDLNSKNIELLFKNNTDFIRISGEISSDQALEFLEEYYKNYYEYTFGEKPKFTLVN